MTTILALLGIRPTIVSEYEINRIDAPVTIPRLLSSKYGIDVGKALPEKDRPVINSQKSLSGT